MASCRVCGFSARTEDQHFCRACGSALVPTKDEAIVAPVPAGRSWAAVLAPLAVAVVCVAMSTVLAVAITPTLASGLDTWARGQNGGEGGGADPTIPQAPPTTHPGREVSVSSKAPTPAETTKTTQPPTPPESTETAELLQHIPSAIAASCVKDPGLKELSEGLQAAVACEDLGPGNVDKIIYMQYDSDSSMQAAYQYAVEVYTNGALQESSGCDDGSARGPWYRDSVEAGLFACYESSSSGVRLWWSTYGTAILARASDEDMSVEELGTWFSKTETGPF